MNSRIRFMKEVTKPDKSTIDTMRKVRKSQRKYKKAIGRNRDEPLVVSILKVRRDAGIPYGE
jgi:hypothetical protein